ncbi:hypothetical protein PV-S19_0033 [Pacmanvirus S19]|nr:hypothetical protein PV-S19_0033 [Pacmanvirus S19]
MSFNNETEQSNYILDNGQTFDNWSNNYKRVQMARKEIDIEKAEPIFHMSGIECAPEINLTTVYDIKNVTSACIKEIDHNKAVIDALTELKVQLLTLKDQKRDIIELRDEITELFTK